MTNTEWTVRRTYGPDSFLRARGFTSQEAAVEWAEEEFDCSVSVGPAPFQGGAPGGAFVVPVYHAGGWEDQRNE